MTDTTFVNGITLTDAGWFQDVNNLVYRNMPLLKAGGNMNGAINEATGSLAVAASMDIGAVAGNTVYVSGAGTVSAFGVSSAPQGSVRRLECGSSFTIANSATIATNTGASIVTQPGDWYEFVLSAGAAQWQLASYMRASGQPLVTPPFRGCIAYNSVNISIPNNLTTLMTFDSEIYDTDTIHSTTTNTDRLTVPTGVSYVKITGQAHFQANATGGRNAYITKNGVPASISGAQQTTSSATTNSIFPIISPILAVVPGDYFSLNVVQDSGGVLDFINGANGAGAYSWFAMEVIR